MIPLIKAEYRKLFSVRSTYFILGLSLLLDIFFSFYVSGWRADAAGLHNPSYIASQAVSAINFLSLFAGLASVLLVTHEYRYNTIMYTLTSSPSRVRVLLAKAMVISSFALAFSFVFGCLAPLLTFLGAHMHDLSLAAQQIPVWSLVWRGLFAGWGFVMLATILAVTIRAQVGAIAAMFLLPGTVEQLLGILLKGNQVYLPFSSLNVLLDVQAGGNHIPYVRAALVAMGYIIFGWIVSLLLFVRRDAN